MEKKGKEKVVVGISVGDINGIGAEIILKTLEDSRITDLFTPVVFGNKDLFDYYTELISMNALNWNEIEELEEIRGGKLNLLKVWDDQAEIAEGKESKTAGEFAFRSLKAATEALKEKKIDALVTAPINKNAIHSANFDFPGHTEYLENADGAEGSLMLMLSESARIGVVTGHIPLHEVKEKLTTEAILKKLTILNKTLKEDFAIRKPKIAVMGLNPHAGDNGLLGKEEEEIITPAINQAKSIDIIAVGPFAADGFFGSSTYTNFDGVLAMYHDQGLIPAKSFAFGQGVNFTAGLSFVRTSPDHGTAFEIAGKGEAKETSFRNAIYYAIDIVKNRRQFVELESDALRPIKSRN